MSRSEISILLDYAEEVDALIEADDGDIFTGPFLTKHEEVMEMLYDLIERN